MKKKYLLVFIYLFFLFNFNPSEVVAIYDPSGDNIGPIDLIMAEAEYFERGDGQTVIKLLLETSPHLPGAVIFECDLDNSTGTGGSVSMLGTPVPPCPCKTIAGFDIAISIFIRQQGDNAGSARCGGCSDVQGTCAKGRRSGHWYAITSTGSQPIGNLGIHSGLLDPLPLQPSSGKTEDCYTLPWSQIVWYANQELQGDPKRFNYQKAIDPSNNKWQVSVWYDGGFTDQDDIFDNYPPGDYFNISDWAPDGDGTIADVLLGGWWTFCEGNFDYDRDVDGGDAATFKSDFGRSAFFMQCGRCGFGH